MTVEETLCWRVSAAVAKVCAPVPGIGGWDRAWEIVEEPSRRFLQYLRTYTTGGDMARKRAENAGNEVVKAWKRAREEYVRMRGAG